MNDIFAPFSFPLHFPESAELHLLLAETFPSKDEALEILVKAGLSKSKVNPDKPVYYLWLDILDYASSKAALRNLLTVAADLIRDDHPLAQFIQALLQNKPPIMAASMPRGANNSVIFFDNNDQVSKEEALLFHDDLTLEAGKIPGLIQSLTIIEKLSPAICRLLVNFNGPLKYGTGFRVSKDQLLTNWHVVNSDGSTPSNITAEFGYEDDENGNIKNSKKIICRTDNIASDKDDDWALLTVTESLDVNIPIIKLTPSVPVLKAPAYILQHPNGLPKRLGYTRNKVMDFSDKTVHYITDTQQGSSGSPVFDGKGVLIALHHMGGSPQKIPGLDPVKKNEGIRISRVLAGLQKQQIVLQD